MKKIILLLMLAMGAAVWYVTGTSDAARVKKSFAKAVSAFQKDGTEPTYTALAKSRTLAELIGPNCRLEIPERNYVSQVGPDFARKIALFRAQSARIQIAFEDLSVSLLDDSTALTTCDFFYSGDAEPLGFLGRDARVLEATLKKDSNTGTWRFAQVRLMPILRK